MTKKIDEVSEEPGDLENRCGYDHTSAHTKCDLLCNNICEAWNKHILKVRDKPAITMLETIRRMLMRRLQEKKVERACMPKDQGEAETTTKALKRM